MLFCDHRDLQPTDIPTVAARRRRTGALGCAGLGPRILPSGRIPVSKTSSLHASLQAWGDAPTRSANSKFWARQKTSMAGHGQEKKNPEASLLRATKKKAISPSQLPKRFCRHRGHAQGGVRATCNERWKDARRAAGPRPRATTDHTGQGHGENDIALSRSFPPYLPPLHIAHRPPPDRPVARPLFPSLLCPLLESA